MASAVRRAGAVSAYGYQPAGSRHDAPAGRRPTGGLAVANTHAAVRQPWAIALERRVSFAWAAARVGALAGGFMGLFGIPATLLTSGHSPLLGLYAAAAPLVGKGALETAALRSMYVEPRALVLGLATCAGVGAVWAVLFGALVWREPHTVGALLPRGMGFGLAVMAVMALVAPRVFGWPWPADVQGWPVVAIGYLLYGYLLGCWPLLRPVDFPPRPRRRQVRAR